MADSSKLNFLQDKAEKRRRGNPINVNRLRKTKNTIRCLTDVESGSGAP